MTVMIGLVLSMLFERCACCPSVRSCKPAAQLAPRGAVASGAVARTACLFTHESGVTRSRPRRHGRRRTSRNIFTFVPHHCALAVVLPLGARGELLLRRLELEPHECQGRAGYAEPQRYADPQRYMNRKDTKAEASPTRAADAGRRALDNERARCFVTPCRQRARGERGQYGGCPLRRRTRSRWNIRITQ
jgi:hypothetical protein